MTGACHLSVLTLLSEHFHPDLPEGNKRGLTLLHFYGIPAQSVFDHLRRCLFKNLNKLHFAVVMESLLTPGTDMYGSYFLSDLAVESEP